MSLLYRSTVEVTEKFLSDDSLTKKILGNASKNRTLVYSSNKSFNLPYVEVRVKRFLQHRSLF